MVKATVDFANSIKEDDYPCLKASDGKQFVVLFIKKKTGIVVSHDKVWPIGHFSSDWGESFFKPFNGTVTLENAKC